MKVVVDERRARRADEDDLIVRTVFRAGRDREAVEVLDGRTDVADVQALIEQIDPARRLEEQPEARDDDRVGVCAPDVARDELWIAEVVVGAGRVGPVATQNKNLARLEDD